MQSARLGVPVVLLFLGITACGQPVPSEDLLFLSTQRGITIAGAEAKSPTFHAPGAVPSRDWSTVVRAESQKRSTRVIALSPSTGNEVWGRSLPGRLMVKIVSEDGHMVALAPTREGYYRRGRSTTRLVIVDGRSSEPKKFELPGNFEPEAFSTDGRSLFLVAYLPARAPTHYQVRRLDLTSGRVVGVYSIDAHLQEAMRGTARIQEMSPDGRRLYTLYTVRGADGSRHAFVHVLSLDELWAHCIDLPDEFAQSAERATALTVATDGERLFVANAVMGILADVDTQALTVTRSVRINFGLGLGAQAISGPDDMLYLASGRRLSAVDGSSLIEKRSWSMAEPISGLQVGGDGKMLYVGLRDVVAVIDPRTGERLGTVDPPGVKRIARLGRVTRSLGARTNLECAC